MRYILLGLLLCGCATVPLSKYEALEAHTAVVEAENVDLRRRMAEALRSFMKIRGTLGKAHLLKEGQEAVK
jgi:hypothetical protein